MRAWKYMRVGGGAGIIVALLMVALWPEPIEVNVAALSRGPMQVTVDEDGETRVRDRFVVSAPVAGRLLRIELEPGDGVTQQSTIVARLAPIDAPLLDARTQAELQVAADAARESVGQARAERDRLIAIRERAQAMAKRYAALIDAGAISAEDFESAQTAVTTAERTLRAAEFALAHAQQEYEQARARLQRPAGDGRLVEMRAPITGVVLKRLHESECVVAAGEPLMEIADPSQIEVVVDLLSTDAVRVREGSRAAIERWGGNHPLGARVRRVEPSGFLKISALGVEEQRVNVVIDFDDPALAARKLGDGYRVDVRVVVWQSDDALRVPVGSLFRRGDSWAVFVVDQDRVRLTAIEVGQRNDESAEVLSGLRESERVVLHPPDTLIDGARVRERTDR
jgi:HlyD family secretion protein